MKIIKKIFENDTVRKVLELDKPVEYLDNKGNTVTVHRPWWKFVINTPLRYIQFTSDKPYVVASIISYEYDRDGDYWGMPVGYCFKRVPYIKN